MECWSGHVSVDCVKIKDMDIINIGDKAFPYDAESMSRIHGKAYGRKAWNSRPEIDYSFKNRMGKEHNIVDIWIKNRAMIDFRVHREEYDMRDVLFVLQTDRSRKPLIISADDIQEFDE